MASRITISSRNLRVIAAAASLIALSVSAQNPIDPRVGQLMERALQDAENFRRQLRGSEYEAKMFVQEWDGRGRLRGTAKATAIMRPGAAHPMTFVSREVHGKVRLPSEDDRDKKDDDDKSTLLDFAREHRMPERYDFTIEGREQVGGDSAVRIRFSPTKRPPEKNRADRFLDTITGTAWISEARNRLVKLELRLVQPLQLFWILAVLKECTIQYELLEPGEILGHAKLKIVFAVTTPIYSIRQQHDVELDHFRRRDPMVTVRGLSPNFGEHLLDIPRLLWSNSLALMSKISLKTELSPDNGGVIDTKWKCGPLSYHICASETGGPAISHNARLPEVVIYDHVGFKGAFARTNLSWNFLGDFWNDRISSLIVVSGVWRFYRDEYYKGDHWDLGPGFYECFFKDKGPDDVISSFKAIELT